MHRDEWEAETLCAECGSEIDPSRDTAAYPYGDGFALCGECAARRGGVYDTSLDRWAILPDLTGLWVMHRPHP